MMMRTKSLSPPALCKTGEFYRRNTTLQQLSKDLWRVILSIGPFTAVSSRGHASIFYVHGVIGMRSATSYIWWLLKYAFPVNCCHLQQEHQVSGNRVIVCRKLEKCFDQHQATESAHVF